MMKLQAFSSQGRLPSDLEISLQSLSELSGSSQEQVKDLEALISALGQQIEQLNASIVERSRTLMENRDYQFLNADIARRTQRTEAETVDGDGSDLLSQVTTAVSKQLLQLQGLEEIPNYTAAAEPLTQAINKLEDEIDSLEAQLEAEQARKRDLVRARDLAWEKYKTLAAKEAEVDVASSITGTEVRFASPALAPTDPVAPKTKLNGLLGGFVGLILAMGLALIVEHPAIKGLSTSAEDERAARND